MPLITPGFEVQRGENRSGFLALAAMLAVSLAFVASARAQASLTKLSTDTFTNTASQHATEVEPDTLSFGSTIVSFIPGIAVDNTTSGANAHLALTYYNYPQSKCISSTCSLNVGFISSLDGGATWSAPTHLAGPMNLAWLPKTSSGRMVGDYISTSFSGGKAHGVFANANANVGTVFDEAMYTTASGLSVLERRSLFTSAGERPVPHAVSDQPPRKAPVVIH